MLKAEDPPSLFGPWAGNSKVRLHEGCQHRLFSEDQVRKFFSLKIACQKRKVRVEISGDFGRCNLQVAMN